MITDYPSLQQAIADWLARADLTAQIPTFIQLAEARMNKDVRVSAMQASYAGYVSLNNSIQLPADCRAVQELRVNEGGVYREMKPLPPTRLTDSAASVRIGYVAQGRTLQLVGGSGQPDFSLLYYQAIPPLADSPLQINWLIQREPGLYLYASLLEASPYIQDDNRATVWAQQYADILDRMNAEDGYMRYGNAPSGLGVGGP